MTLNETLKNAEQSPSEKVAKAVLDHQKAGLLDACIKSVKADTALSAAMFAVIMECLTLEVSERAFELLEGWLRRQPELGYKPAVVDAKEKAHQTETKGTLPSSWKVNKSRFLKAVSQAPIWEHAYTSRRAALKLEMAEADLPPVVEGFLRIGSDRYQKLDAKQALRLFNEDCRKGQQAQKAIEDDRKAAEGKVGSAPSGSGATPQGFSSGGYDAEAIKTPELRAAIAECNRMLQLTIGHAAPESERAQALANVLDIWREEYTAMCDSYAARGGAKGNQKPDDKLPVPAVA